MFMRGYAEIVIWFAMWLTATSDPDELADETLIALKQLSNVWDTIYWRDEFEYEFDVRFYYRRLYEIRCIFFKYICARRALYNYVCEHGVRDCSFFNFFVYNFVDVS